MSVQSKKEETKRSLAATKIGSRSSVKQAEQQTLAIKDSAQLVPQQVGKMAIKQNLVLRCTSQREQSYKKLP